MHATYWAFLLFTEMYRWPWSQSLPSRRLLSCSSPKALSWTRRALKTFRRIRNTSGRSMTKLCRPFRLTQRTTPPLSSNYPQSMFSKPALRDIYRIVNVCMFESLNPKASPCIIPSTYARPTRTQCSCTSLSTKGSGPPSMTQTMSPGREHKGIQAI